MCQGYDGSSRLSAVSGRDASFALNYLGKYDKLKR